LLAARSEAFASWRRFFESLAELRPLVLVFEDLHWADDGVLGFVDHLVEWDQVPGLDGRIEPSAVHNVCRRDSY
jgi:predicted ATPase